MVAAEVSLIEQAVRDGCKCLYRRKKVTCD